MNSKAIKRQLLAAIAMVLVAAIALGSSTYAWFAGQNSVKAEGMSVQVQGESGILIKYTGFNSTAVPGGVYSTTASANQELQPKTLYPVSVRNLAENLTNWYHATSKFSNNAQGQQKKDNYKTLQELNATATNYYIANHFSIRAASNNVDLENMDLAVTNVTATEANVTSGQTGNNINKALRVGVLLTRTLSDQSKVDSNFFIYAPNLNGGFNLIPNYLATGDGTADETDADKYTYAGVTAFNEPKGPSETGDVLAISDHKIPSDDSTLVATVFVWYEGEDENCISDNIDTTLNAMNISVTFATTPYVAPEP